MHQRFATVVVMNKSAVIPVDSYLGAVAKRLQLSRYRQTVSNSAPNQMKYPSTRVNFIAELDAQADAVKH